MTDSHFRFCRSGGDLWFSIYKFSMIALYMSVVTMIGYMALKEGAIETPCLVPLLVIVYLADRSMVKQFKKKAVTFPYSTAAKADLDLDDNDDNDSVLSK
jgi:hypothetical protein